MKYQTVITWSIGLASALFGVQGAQAQKPADYPNRPINFQVGYAAGGSADTIGRIVLPALANRLGQPIVLDNKAGAGGVVGLVAVAKSKPDGYTMGFGTAGTLASNINLIPNLPYDPVKDLAPVSMVVDLPLVLVSNPASSGVSSVADLVKRAKGGEEISYGSAGPGSSTNLAGELLNQLAGIKMAHVPYRGTAPALADVMGGVLQAAFVDLPTALPHVGSGRLKILAVTSAKRTALAPDLPTMAESGVPGYHFISWFGIVMPAGTPPAIVNYVNRELVAVLKDPQTRQRVLAAGADPAPSTPEQMSQVIRSEIASTARIIQTAGIKLTN
jgi:tripartite-type tricarboxylate transporter receptor subunit TctC